MITAIGFFLAVFGWLGYLFTAAGGGHPLLWSERREMTAGALFLVTTIGVVLFVFGVGVWLWGVMP